jgi:hypothetical protein
MKYLFSRLGDWRIPLILAVPVLVWIGVFALGSITTPSSATANDVSVTIKDLSTPRPSFVPTPYPTVAPSILAVPATGPDICQPITVRALVPSMATTRDNSGHLQSIAFTLRDDRGRVVPCALLRVTFTAGLDSFRRSETMTGTLSFTGLPAGRITIAAVFSYQGQSASLDTAVAN